MDLRAVVRHYRANHATNSEAELNSFRTEPTVEEAVGRAALAETPDGRRYSHQRRLKPKDLAEARDALLKRVTEFEGVTNFARLYALLESICRSRRGLGELYVYDTALRIGARLGHLPKCVYLHAGTREGARLLHLDPSGKTIQPWELPSDFRELEPHQVEDVLCIYKKYFSGKIQSLDDAPDCWLDDVEEE